MANRIYYSLLGLCSYCGKVHPDYPLKHCRGCLDKINNRSRRRKLKEVDDD